ncbi:MAG: hypothetical protein GY737_13800 [Desulfobacteraceae bacterium]|nr:hypothetical protein [Desulfobacteraceae bacterium]
MQNLPIVNIFSEPYEIWSMRSPTIDEMMERGLHCQIKDRLIAKIHNHYEAATHTLLNCGCTRLDDLIKEELNNSSSFKRMREMMPSRTAQQLSDFQNKFQSTHFDSVSNIVYRDGKRLAEGQILYHGGFWSGAIGQEFVTERPLSTSFSPHMACQNANWAGKSYDAGELHLIILRVVNPQASAFCFRINGTNKGHEKEVLFETGARLTLRSKTLIKSDGVAYKACDIYAGKVLNKTIPFYVLEMDVS